MCTREGFRARGGRGVQRTERTRAVSGFTLIEIAIVVVMTGILLMVALPPMARAYRSRLTQSGADRFVLTHSLARSVALQYGRIAELHIDAAAARFWVEVDSSGTGVRDTVGFMHDLGSDGLTVTSTRSIVCFDARGLATTRGPCQPADVTITFAVSGHVDTLTTTALGKVLR